jgi:uncharacterized membrane protein YhiD involved in acid resistance
MAGLSKKADEPRVQINIKNVETVDPPEIIRSGHERSKRLAKIALVALVLGVIGTLLGGAIVLVSVLLPTLTDGRTSWDEAMLGIIPGALLLSLSFILAVVGLIVMILKRSRKVKA